ncbi:Spy/CpxP family protein refolding chaperone [Bradyrhizobium sp.]|uniref:Spy/CpxP family protein refolding chaperone n=1 Tax=Bradyrhizobium sp. TaxID=376 RepID=UPI001D6F4FB4|nr:Spy/CpxP family protein refolding chaperone [Bradyrhizobium sp.]MBI5320195.1 Spy/CpxP family protein refolding chaperone [Bradyrhizobium sp.]
MKRLALAALLLATASSPSFAQTADHDHSHGQKEAPAAQQPAQPGGQSGMGGSSGMQGMKGGGGMMKSMGGKMPMMDMMQKMGMMQQAGGGMGMATIDHVEGRIAFLRAELKITDAQNAAWNAFADALRANARSLGEVRSSIVSGMAGAAQPSLVDRFALQEKWLAARLEGTRAIKAALGNLIGALSDDQKKSADELLAPHMGMMSMMQPGQTGPGAMQPGR